MQQEYKYLYHLTFLDPVLGWTPFYVGKTNHPKDRAVAHKRDWKTGTEDKYVFIRDVVEQKHFEWNFELIKEVPKGDYHHDWERWHVIDYTRQGFTLFNMKHGDLDKIEVDEQVANVKIRSASDVKKDRVRRVEERKFAAAERLRKKVLREEEDQKKEALREKWRAGIAEQERQAQQLLQNVAQMKKTQNIIKHWMAEPTGWRRATKRLMTRRWRYKQFNSRVTIWQSGDWKLLTDERNVATCLNSFPQNSRWCMAGHLLKMLDSCEMITASSRPTFKTKRGMTFGERA